MRLEKLWRLARWIAIFVIGWRVFEQMPQWVEGVIVIAIILYSLRENTNNEDRNAA